MRKKTEHDGQNSSVKKAVFFCLIVAMLLLLSLLVRFVTLLKDGKYDGKSRFTIAIEQQRPVILSFDPVNKRVSQLTVSEKNASQSLEQTLGIPIDARVRTKKPLEIDKDPTYYLTEILLHPSTSRKEITEVDVAYLLFFAKSLLPKDFTIEKLDMPKTTSEVDSISEQLFADSKIIDDNISIEIINGTNTAGLGKRLERVVKNIGGNVVMVSNTRTVENVSKIYYYQDKSYTLDRLEKYLHISAKQRSSRGVADISIIIGEDKAGAREF